jgi:hypothetical protein
VKEKTREKCERKDGKRGTAGRTSKVVTGHILAAPATTTAAWWVQGKAISGQCPFVTTGTNRKRHGQEKVVDCEKESKNSGPAP